VTTPISRALDPAGPLAGHPRKAEAASPQTAAQICGWFASHDDSEFVTT